MKTTDKTFLNKALYFTGLGSAILFGIVVVWMYLEFFWGLWTLNWYTFVLVTAGAVLAIVEVFRLVWKHMKAMRKRPFGSGSINPVHKVVPLIFLVTSILLLGYFAGPISVQSDMYPHLSFTGDPATSITVSWYSTSAHAGNVSYGTTPASLSSFKEESSMMYEHAITLQGLAPNTTYYYRVGGFEQTWQFKTASGAAEQVHFTAVSDVHNDFNLPVRDGIVEAKPDFTIITGDLVDYGGWKGSWGDFFTQLAPIATNQSVMTVIGNHDAFFGGTANYQRFLSLPSTSGDERWYHFEYNGVHFVSLDLEWGAHSYSTAQRSWFESLLDTIPQNEWLVVYNHCMHYSSGNNEENTGMVDTFHQLFLDHDVDLVISGHNHHAEIYPVDGVVYTVIGTASNELTPRQHDAESGSVFFDLAHQAFLDVTINGSNCSLSIQRYENGMPMAPVLYSFLQ